MQDFVHLHVHTQYPLFDGQASVSHLMDKAVKDGMKGTAITDHGSMLGIKGFTNYVNKENGGPRGETKDLKKRTADIENGEIAHEDKETEIAACEGEIAKAESKPFGPIIGCETYVAHYAMDKKEGKPDQSGYHLIVLTKNERGYHSLIELVSYTWTMGYYMRPRANRNELEKYHEGLIVCSACIGGEIPKEITDDQLDETEEAARWYKNLFGGDSYLELQHHKVTIPRANHEAYPLQQKANTKLLEYVKKYGIKVTYSSDVHFVDEENAEAHDRLICPGTDKDSDDLSHILYTKQGWMKTKAETNEFFTDAPEVLSDTLETLDKAEYYSTDHAPIAPTLAIPEGFGTEEEYRKRYMEKDLLDEFIQGKSGSAVLDGNAAKAKIKCLGGYDKLHHIRLEADYLAELASGGAKRLYGDPLSDEVKERLVFELYIMRAVGFPGYLLIMQGFIDAAHTQLGVSVGPGRGSTAGSAVACRLGITKTDPIQYDLLFKRPLNPNRISLPDTDVGFDSGGHDEVLRWVTEKYGQEEMAYIITRGIMTTKLAIEDAAHVQKLPLPEPDRLARLVPDKIPDRKLNLSNAIAYVSELQTAEASPDPLMRDTLKYVKVLKDNVRGAGVHACGTIICRDDITGWVPVSTADDKETGGKMLVIQYEGSVTESMGLIKMDFLGPETLSAIKEAVENVRLRQGVKLDIDRIFIKDPATYKLYCDGRIIGTFQFESIGMQRYLCELQPSIFKDLIAMNVLYRPGPMDCIPNLIDRKWGHKPIEYDTPIMEKYLKDAYGITVYQERVMLLPRLLANSTRGESDALCKVMGKKLRDKLDRIKPKSITDGQKNGHDPRVLEKVWADWEESISYAFNKSHTTCYSRVAYQTAFLKADYPAGYTAAVVNRSLSDVTTITKLMSECKSMGIKVLGPNVNGSNLKFIVNLEGNIRFRLGAIKGMGEGATRGIMEECKKSGPYTGVFDLVQCVSLNSHNKENLECLALAGGFDSFPKLKREQYLAASVRNEVFIETLMRYGNRYQANKVAAVNSLLGGENAVDVVTPEIPPAERWSDLDRLSGERDSVGIYLSAHPLDEYSVVLEHVCNTRMAGLEDKAALVGREITMGGIVTSTHRGISKNGNPYGIAKIEDYSGSAELPFLGNDWVAYQGYLSERTFLYIKVRCQPKQRGQDELELKMASTKPLPDVKEKPIKKITILIPLSVLNKALVTGLLGLTKVRLGTTELYFRVTDLDSRMTVDLMSHPVKLSVGRELTPYSKERPELEFRINQLFLLA